MIRWRFVVFELILLVAYCQCGMGQKPVRLRILDVTTDKARYAPGAPVTIEVIVGNSTSSVARATLRLGFYHVEEKTSPDLSRRITLRSGENKRFIFVWQPSSADYQGYFVDVHLLCLDGRQLDHAQTAVDVSSQWNRFPRYGYLAHYSAQKGAEPEVWIDELNRFHIDGLEYYDFQNRHEQPLAGTVEHPADKWFDVGGRQIERSIVNRFLAAARSRNMMSMAYNASYSAYEDAFRNGSGVLLEWATWPRADGKRTLESAKSLNLPDTRWKTRRLIFMNQNLPAWQNYLFGQMHFLFRVYPFDGWHIDTFGDAGAFAFDGSPVDFVAGFRPFLDHAKTTLGKRVLLNTVGTLGEEQTALSRADFVYSELWDQNETYAGILSAADRVHRTNPNAGLIFAAYLHRVADRPQAPAGSRSFNPPSVLLADAAIFASGAAHIELGDGQQMLSSEYFPDDAAIVVSPNLRAALRRYYDFLTAYENILRDQIFPTTLSVEIVGVKTSTNASADTVWCLSRQTAERKILHLINLQGSKSDSWRDVNLNRQDAPLLRAAKVRIFVDEKILSASWASPDRDGVFHALNFQTGSINNRRYIELTIPTLKYWDVIVLKIAYARH